MKYIQIKKDARIIKLSVINVTELNSQDFPDQPGNRADVSELYSVVLPNIMLKDIDMSDSSGEHSFTLLRRSHGDEYEYLDVVRNDLNDIKLSKYRDLVLSIIKYAK